MPADQITLVEDVIPHESLARARWYAVHTRSNFEKRIADELAAKGLESYLPAYEEVHQWKDRRKTIIVPLFPGYVFARFQDFPKLRLAVLRTTGVAQILGRGGMIEAVPDEEIEAVCRLLRSKSPCFSHPFPQEGQRVRVKQGALKGLEGVLARIKNRTRLVISVNLICQSVAAEVDAEDTEPVYRAVAGYENRLFQPERERRFGL